MNDRAEDTVRTYWAGMITFEEMQERLEALNVRGGVDESHFTGYDYYNQEWLEYQNIMTVEEMDSWN